MTWREKQLADKLKRLEAEQAGLSTGDTPKEYAPVIEREMRRTLLELQRK